MKPQITRHVNPRLTRNRYASKELRHEAADHRSLPIAKPAA